MSVNNKKFYTVLFQKLRNVLNEIDPEGLCPGKENGCPIDEYDSETRELIIFVNNNNEDLDNKNILVDKINLIWKKYFDSECSKSFEIADAIHKITEENKGSASRKLK